MPDQREIRKVVSGSRQEDGAGVRLVRVIGHADVQEFDPFLMLDAFDSRNPDDYVRGFPWHPHRGIETVTYLISGNIEHGDSLGNKGAIVDGSCQWMTAGSGIIHQEMPQPSERMLGLQLWVNLPRKDKMTEPQYRDIKPDSVPKLREGNAAVAIVSGTYGGVAGPTQGDYVKVLALDVELTPGASWHLATSPDDTVFAYLFEGSGTFGTHTTPIESHRAVLFGEGRELVVKAGPEGLRFMLFAGKPLREPIAWGGPIVMNTREELRQAFAEIDNNTFIRHPR
ncbi:MAG TPA: pirin family protein [Candidatus Ozemobacteraceae bacterium]|nr:pirin family protein [Candidatus Ozemobacteraceae bacterium]